MTNDDRANGAESWTNAEGASVSRMATMDLALAAAARGALFAVNHSGGKDSQAMLIRLLEVVPRAQMVVIHASLGDVEWPGALEQAQEGAKVADLPFVVARAGKDLLGMVVARHASRPEVPSWPSAAHRQCTSDLKRGPIEREVRRLARERGTSVVVNCMGLRAEESPGRAKKEAWRRNDRLSVSGREWFDWLPIHHLATAEVFETIAAAGQEPHPAYALGNQRLSCVFCILSNASDLRNGAIRNPDLYAQYVDLERRTGYTAHQSRKSMVELTGLSTEQAAAENLRIANERVSSGGTDRLIAG